MGNIAEEFVENFHLLDGVRIGEKRKNFFKLLHQNSGFLKDNTESLNFIVSHLQPKTFLEELFKVDFLIYFRMTQELHKILNEGNDIFVSKVAKQTWFFKEYFNDIEPGKLVNEILPCMSYSVRMKVLGKLCKYLDSGKFEQIFNAVAARYGIFAASKFICGCTPKKIQEVVLTNRIRLKSTQLKILYLKDPELIVFFFAHGCNPVYGRDNRNLINFLFINDRNLYNFIIGKYNLSSTGFGRRSTKNFVDSFKDDIIENPHNYRYLKMKAVFRKIGKDSLTLFRNALPEKFENLDEIQWLLGDVPLKYRYSLYVKTVEDHYQQKFLLHPHLITESFLDLIADNFERAAYAKVLVEGGDDGFIKYLEIPDSIPLLKEKINLTSDIVARGKLIKYLVEACSINKNIETLVEVLKYFNSRHKNDSLNTHIMVMNSIQSLFGFKVLTEEMWNLLNELLLIHTLKNNIDNPTYKKIQTLPLMSYNLGITTEQKLFYLNFLSNKGAPIDALLTDLSYTDHEFPTWGKYSYQFEKKFLLFAIERGNIEEFDDYTIKYNCSLINSIRLWNLYYTKDCLSFYDFPSLVKAFDYALDNTSYLNFAIKEIFRSKIFTVSQNEYKYKYLEFYWKHYATYVSYKDLKWFLKHDPATIIKYFSPFFGGAVKLDVKMQLRLWHIVKKFNHLHLDETCKKLCVSNISDEDNHELKSNFIICLSVLMKPDEYVVIANTYRPANKELDLSNEQEVRQYNLQCTIAKHFKNTRSYEVLTSLLNYCAGDYFKYSISSLYSILYRTPESMLPKYLTYLSKKAVSVRKHALYMSAELTSVTKVESMLKLLTKNKDVSSSLQKKHFETTIKYFVKNPSDSFFEMVKLNMINIKKTDYETLKCITQDFLYSIPEEYMAPYIEYTWDFIEKNLDESEKTSFMKKQLIGAIKAKICPAISLQFGLNILNKYFVDEIDWVLNLSFILLQNRQEKSVILQNILNLVEACNYRNKMYVFKQFQNVVMSSTEDVSYLQPCVDYYEKIIEVQEDFQEHIQLYFMKMKLDGFCRNITSICSKTIEIFKSLISVYGAAVISIFASQVFGIIDEYFTKDLLLLDYMEHFITKYPSNEVAIMILHVIDKPNYDERLVKFNTVLRNIKKIENPGVQLLLHYKWKHYLRSPQFCSEVVKMKTQ